ncbi:recombinase family protein [Pseudomonas alabamensis]|uniref:recombinase family protein n=1 Tax=Pseudomonas alabamensis TaxID=3064349 RepID=UPI003F651296
MPSAIPYIRFSSVRQIGSNSIERQRQMVNQWLLKHNEYTLSNLTYEDLGRSGYHGEHLKDDSGFTRLLQAVNAGLIKAGDCVLVEAIDRTGRLSPMRMLREVISPIIESGVSIITLDDGVTYDQTSVEGGHLFLLVAKIQAAHSYSKALSERTKASYAIRREQARKTGKVKRHTPIWLTSDGEVIEHIAMHVREAFDLYISGMGKTAIANRIRASSIGELKKCSGPTITNWLSNRAAIGYWNDVKVYPAIVSVEKFTLAHQRAKKLATAPPQRTGKSLFSGLLVCGVCNSNYITHWKDGKENNMRCGLHHRLKHAGCSNAETIPIQIARHVYRLTAPKFNSKALAATKLTNAGKRIIEIRDRISAISDNISRLVKMIALADMPEIEQQLNELNNERSILNNELNSLKNAQTEAPLITTTEHIEFKKLSISDPVKASAMLKQAGYKIVVHPGKKLSVAETEHLFIYKGIHRHGNKTIGYKLEYNGTLSFIPPTGSSVALSSIGESVNPNDN